MLPVRGLTSSGLMEWPAGLHPDSLTKRENRRQGEPESFCGLWRDVLGLQGAHVWPVLVVMPCTLTGATCQRGHTREGCPGDQGFRGAPRDQM